MSTQTLKPAQSATKSTAYDTMARIFVQIIGQVHRMHTPVQSTQKKYSKSWESWVTPPWLLSTYYGQLDISRGSLAAPVLREFGAHLVGNDAAPAKFSIDIELIIQARKQEYLVVAGWKGHGSNCKPIFLAVLNGFKDDCPILKPWKRRLPMAIWHWPQQMVETNHMMLMSSIHSSSWPLKANNLCFQQTFVKNHQISFTSSPLSKKKSQHFPLISAMESTSLLLTNLCLHSRRIW